ncbi:hypothetical protein LX32DRAFT_638554 [Colletotrichum zoysiae]|uniref:Apple domain-containing protein n=1 Tax=Colletotrichum zoysiae TaxID=1216348 RepID=A0AAD9HJ26_9PEZI|nr:hypothetical protein LX32DRAFT_638554 [Colletotrichum zoysiae]
MLFTVYSTILLFFLGSAALAANVNRDNSPARDQCTTQYGGSSVKSVLTSTSTVRRTSTQRTTVTPTITRTAQGRGTVTVTSTATETSTVTTSIPGITATASITATVFLTQTGPAVTVTTNVATTTTTTLSTGTVVPTSSGFRPANDTIPGPNMSYKKRSSSNISPVHRALDPASFDIEPWRQKRTNKQYPSKVECTTTETTTVTSTCTARAVTVTVPGVATTATTTTTTTTPAIITERGPSVTVTVTVTVSSLAVLTPTITTTVITTSTETVTTFTATVYAACASGTGNLVYTARDDNSIIPRVIPNGLVQQPALTVASPSECCSLCFADPQCAVSSFGVPYADRQCNLYYTPTVEACSAPDSFSAGVRVLPTPYPFLVVSNGRCGQFNYFTD